MYWQSWLMTGIVLGSIGTTQCCLTSTLGPMVRYMYNKTIQVMETHRPTSVVDGGWSLWNDWSACSQTCGRGNQYRQRACTSPAPSALDQPCQGPARESSMCFAPCNASIPITDITIIDGGWSTWGNWSDCSLFCGSGFQYRERTCSDPSPSLLGLPCHGSATENITCFTPCNTSSTLTNIVEICEMSITDIAFLIDTSGSIDDDEWQQQIKFVRKVVEGFNIGPDAIQVAAATFSWTNSKEFFLNEHTTRHDVLDAIDRIPQRDGFTYTSKGLAFVWRHIFTAANGDRPNAPNVLIVLTDGSSSTGYNPNLEAAILKSMGVIIIAIGVGDGNDESELEAMATSRSHMLNVTDFTSLEAIQEEVQSRACEVCNVYEYLKQREGFKLTGYHPTSASGVTIATGVDLGQQSAAGLRDLNVPVTIIDKLKPYLGLKKEKDVSAKSLKASGLTLTKKEAELLDNRFVDMYMRETRPFSTEMTCVGKDVLVSLRHWAGALGNTKGQGKLSLKVGAGTKNYVWDAIKGKTATDAQLKTALEKTLKHHTLRSATHNRIKAEIAHLIS